MELQVNPEKVGVLGLKEEDVKTLPTDPFDLPFQSKLCFLPLIRKVEEIAATNAPGEATLAKEVLKKLEGAPELQAPIVDLSILDDHRDLVNLLLLFVVPAGQRDQLLIKISSPFKMEPIYISPKLMELFEQHDVRYMISKSDNIIYCACLVRACSLILNKFYNQQIEIDPPISLAIQRKDSPLERYFKTQMNFDFVDIVATKPIKPLSQDQIDQLMSNIYDADLWLKLIPVDTFEFHGFITGNLIDITEEEALSRLKHKLLRQDAVVSKESILELERLLRTYFDLPELQLGLAAIDYPQEFKISHQYKIRFNILSDYTENLLDNDYSGSIYERACEYGEMLLMEDLRKVKNPGPLEKELLNRGIRSIIVAPLMLQDKRVIGLVEIASPNPYEIHSFIELKFQEIRGLFRTALARSRDEIDNQIEAMMREQFTALHPSVEWRFMDESFKLLEQKEAGQRLQVADIEFKDVYPLYGQADIVNSSLQRNESIKADLVTNLIAAEKVLERTLEMIKFPLAHKLLLSIQLDLEHLRTHFNSSDETRIIEFLFSEVHPLFKQLRKEYRGLRDLIDRYFDKLDDDFGVIYDKRKDYESSVALLNTTIGMFLDERQEELQKVLPHYFEKYKTDGVEYEMYLGQSMMKMGCFSDIHLCNFRLWQLIHMAEITRLVAELRPNMAVPLTTAQLVFAYTNTLTIQFRVDEKRFDVEGAYNVRYEILKKRIDKARIEGSNERLTQAGKVAIVYLQEKDRREYLSYLDYLKHEGYIDGEVEDVRLGALQGVQGLRALRFTVRIPEE